MIVNNHNSSEVNASNPVNEKKPNLIFLGAPGAGKGSVAAKLVKDFDYFQLSTGDMFRSEIKNKTPLGLEIKSVLASGKYVDDALTNRLVEGHITNLYKLNKAFILDGYPRTIEQANFLETLQAKSIKIDKVILLEITDEQIIERLSKRRICPQCKKIHHMEFNCPIDGKYCRACGAEVIKRPDDEPSVVKERLAVYKKQTKCLIDYYSEKGVLTRINSYQEFDNVYSDVKKALGWL